MKISPVANYPKMPQMQNKINSNNAKQERNVSFKSIYVENIVDLGNVKAGSFPAKFETKDALLMQEIAIQYPYQDCFIKKGYSSLPCLEFREKPIDVEIFNNGISGTYDVAIEYDDLAYEAVPMMLYNNPDLEGYKRGDINYEIGVPSYISTNPSLHYTIQMGFECHKKVMEKKNQILEVVGKNDEVSLGDDSLITKSHNAMEEVEIATIRYLIECAFLALTKKASARKIYESNYPKIQSALTEKRNKDLVTCKELQPVSKEERKGIDVCTEIMELYPNPQENIERIDELMNYMTTNGITLYDSEDLNVKR